MLKKTLDPRKKFELIRLKEAGNYAASRGKVVAKQKGVEKSIDTHVARSPEMKSSGDGTKYIASSSPRKWVSVLEQYMTIMKNEIPRQISSPRPSIYKSESSLKLSNRDTASPSLDNDSLSNDLDPSQYAVLFCNSSIPLRALHRHLVSFKAALLNRGPSFVHDFVVVPLNSMVLYPSGYHGVGSLEICLTRVINAKRSRLENSSMMSRVEGELAPNSARIVKLYSGYAAAALEDELSCEIFDCFRIIMLQNIGVAAISSVAVPVIRNIISILYFVDFTLSDPVKSGRTKRVHLGLRIVATDLLVKMIFKIDVTWKTLLDLVPKFAPGPEHRRWKPLILSTINPFVPPEKVEVSPSSVIFGQNCPENNLIWIYRKSVIGLLTAMLLRASHFDKKIFLSEFENASCYTKVINTLMKLDPPSSFLKAVQKYSKTKERILFSKYANYGKWKGRSLDDFLKLLRNASPNYLDSEKLEYLLMDVFEGLLSYFLQISEFSQKAKVPHSELSTFNSHISSHLENLFKVITVVLGSLCDNTSRGDTKNVKIDLIKLNEGLLDKVVMAIKGNGKLGVSDIQLNLEGNSKRASRVFSILPSKPYPTRLKSDIKSTWDTVRDLEDTYREIERYKDSLAGAIKAKKLGFLSKETEPQKRVEEPPEKSDRSKNLEALDEMLKNSNKISITDAEHKDDTQESVESKRGGFASAHVHPSRKLSVQHPLRSSSPAASSKTSTEEHKVDSSAPSPPVATTPTAVPPLPLGGLFKLPGSIPLPPRDFGKPSIASPHHAVKTPMDKFVEETLSEMKELKGVQFKNLKWDKIDGDNQDTVWNKIVNLEDGDVNLKEFIHVDDFVKYFCAAKPAPKNDDVIHGASIPVSESPSRSKKVVTLIDRKRSQNISIMLAGMRCPIANLIKNIITVNDQFLTIDRLTSLNEWIPSQEEIDIVRKYDGDKSILDTAETYILELSGIPNVAARLGMMLFRKKFIDEIRELDHDTDALTLACRQLVSSDKLKKILAVILGIGNIMNNSTFRGKAKGFKVKSLLNVKSITSSVKIDGCGPSLLHYIAKILHEKDPALINFITDLPRLKEALNINIVSLVEAVKELRSGIEVGKKHMSNIDSFRLNINDNTNGNGNGNINDDTSEDVFCKIFPEFYDSASLLVTGLSYRSDEAKSRYIETLEYFGENFDDWRRAPEEFFATFTYFCTAMKEAHIENLSIIERRDRKKVRAAATLRRSSTVAALNKDRKDGHLLNANMAIDGRTIDTYADMHYADSDPSFRPQFKPYDAVSSTERSLLASDIASAEVSDVESHNVIGNAQRARANRYCDSSSEAIKATLLNAVGAGAYDSSSSSGYSDEESTDADSSEEEDSDESDMDESSCSAADERWSEKYENDTDVDHKGDNEPDEIENRDTAV